MFIISFTGLIILVLVEPPGRISSKGRVIHHIMLLLVWVERGELLILVVYYGNICTNWLSWTEVSGTFQVDGLRIKHLLWPVKGRDIWRLALVWYGPSLCTSGFHSFNQKFLELWLGISHPLFRSSIFLLLLVFFLLLCDDFFIGHFLKGIRFSVECILEVVLAFVVFHSTICPQQFTILAVNFDGHTINLKLPKKQHLETSIKLFLLLIFISVYEIISATLLDIFIWVWYLFLHFWVVWIPLVFHGEEHVHIIMKLDLIWIERHLPHFQHFVLPKLLGKLFFQSCYSGLSFLFTMIASNLLNFFSILFDLFYIFWWLILNRFESNFYIFPLWRLFTSLLWVKVERHRSRHILIESVFLTAISWHRLKALRFPLLDLSILNLFLLLFMFWLLEKLGIYVLFQIVEYNIANTSLPLWDSRFELI